MNNQLTAGCVKSLSLRQARRHSKTLVEMTIGIIGLSGLLMAQLGQTNQLQEINQLSSLSINNQLIAKQSSQDRHLVTFLLAKSSKGSRIATSANKACQSSWLGVFL
ncbi:MAG: hypothetical protein Q9M92_15395 [Enterobacterales bacterium]|nr:hypothetical protein [Enterobacterales bacterium]